MDLDKLKVLVVGMGRSGVAAARLCAERGAAVTATDSRSAEQLGAPVAELEDTVTLELGGHDERSFGESDLIVVSPGVPPLPELEAAARAGVEIIGELELGYRFVEAPVVAITGTNGKSTTTKLTGEMLAASGFDVFCGGNLGQPLCEAVNDGAVPGPAGALVLEVSSFQLETVRSFRARVATLLNLSEDHLDRYPDYDAYLAAKARIFERQTSDDFAVANADPDQLCCRQLASASSAPLLTFRSERSRGTGAWIDDGELCLRLPRGQVEKYARASLELPGRHNAQNALAALVSARLAGATIEGCARALEGFEGLPHRMQLVGERGGVRFYDDSKATNVGAVVGSLAGFERRVVLIAGGKDKGGDYGPLKRVLEETCSCVVLIGAAAELMQRALAGSAPLHRADEMRGAVALASSLAREGEAVVLSPACSSFDMYRNFEERGRDFAAAVSALDDA